MKSVSSLYEDSLPVGKSLDHWQQFFEFCHYERAVGGPDPHMRCVGKICEEEHCSVETTAWRGALYCAVYNVPTAIALWRKWPVPDAARLDDKAVDWLREHWQGIALRRERKAVRSPEKLGRCVKSLAGFCVGIPERIAKWSNGANPVARFENAFEDVCEVYGVGRYIGQKFIEYGRRYAGFPVQVQDIRAKGGWSPREGLALLFPESVDVLNSGDAPEAVTETERLAASVAETMAQEFDFKVDFYELQVLLCDYKQSFVGKRQYPGRSQDSELSYEVKIQPHWQAPSVEMFKARSSAFPHRVLGEHGGWPGVREILGRTLSDYGYTWSDLKYNWLKTRNDLKNPVAWQ